MRHYIHITILTMLFGLFGCKDNKKQDFVFNEFKSQIESLGMKINSVDENGIIYIQQGELTYEISLDNTRKNYERDKDEKHIADLVQMVASSSMTAPENWADAKEDIYISLYPNDYDFHDFLHKQITNEFSKIYIYSGSDKFIWISKNDIEKWGITEAELDIQANNNADKLLQQTPIAFDSIENRKLGRIDLEHEHGAIEGALLFAPTMKEKVKADFGFPFYAIIPNRSFCYIFSEKDFDFFFERVGNVVVDEYKQSGYPITTEILKFTDNRVEAVRKYPVN